MPHIPTKCKCVRGGGGETCGLKNKYQTLIRAKNFCGIDLYEAQIYPQIKRVTGKNWKSENKQQELLVQKSKFGDPC